MSDSDSDPEIRAGRLIDEIKALIGEEYVEEEESDQQDLQRHTEQGEGSDEEEEEDAQFEEEAFAGDDEEPQYAFDIDNMEEDMTEGSQPPSGKHEVSVPAAQTDMEKWLSAKKFQVQKLREACACRNESLEELAGTPAAAMDLSASKTAGLQRQQASATGLDRKTQTEKALGVNLKLRQRLQKTLEELEACAQENAAVMARLEAAVDSSEAIRCRSRLVRDAEDTGGRVGFWNIGREKPHPHPDAIKLEQALHWLPRQIQHKAWAPQEDARLKHAVLRLVRDRKFGGQLDQLEQQVNSGEASAIIAIQSMRQAVEAMCHDTQEVDVLGRAMNDEDWQKVWKASGLARARSAMDCRLRWLNDCRPGLEKGGWSAEANQRLLKLTEEHGLHAWQRISEEMKHKYTPAQCLARYRQGHCFSRQKQQHWPQAEDIRLADMIKLHGEGKWKAIASGMPGRTPAQCRAHWSTVIKPGMRKGPWSDEESAMLAKAVQMEGLVWSKVALHVPGRNQLQCRERWYKKANPDRKTTGFTEQEDAALRDLVPKRLKDAGETDWPALARDVPGRTSQDCKRRWTQLVRQSNGPRKRKSQKRNNSLPVKDDLDGQTPHTAEDAAMASQDDAANASPLERVARRSLRRKATRPSSPSPFLESDTGEAGQPDPADADSGEANSPKRSRRQAPCPPAKHSGELAAEVDAQLPQQAYAGAWSHGSDAEGRSVHAACGSGEAVDVEHTDAQNAQHATAVAGADIAREDATAGLQASGRRRRGSHGRRGGAARRGGRKRQPVQHALSPSSGDSAVLAPTPLSPISQQRPLPGSPATGFPAGAQGGEGVLSCDLERLAYFSAQPQLVHEQLSLAMTGGPMAGLPLPSLTSEQGKRGLRTSVRKSTALL